MNPVFPPVVIGVPSLQSGDAVSNDVLGMYHALESIGVDVRLFPCDYALSLEKQVIGLDSVPDFLGDNGLFIYHFCVKWEAANELMSRLRCVRIIKYHNITPGHFFSGISSRYEQVCNGSHDFIQATSSLADYLWADSRFNAGDFESHGFPVEQIQILPPFHHTERLLDATPDPGWLAKLDDGRINILFVGRLAPNKNHPLLIEAFAIFKQQFPRARLLITGGRDAELSSYTSRLDDQVASLGLQDDILFCGKVPDEVLASLYRKAHLFAVTSLHEGFCVPLLEAMAFAVPIVALSRCAVPETAKNATEYCEADSAEEFACAMSRALEAGRALELKQLGRQRYQEEFTHSALDARFLDAITPMLAPLRRPIRAIHQFHSGSAYGDAITNGMLVTREMLQRMGFVSEIYVQHIAPELQDILKPHTQLIPSEDAYVLLHHSMGHDLDAFIATFAGHGALVYHNITPARFFPNNPHIQSYIEKGLNQLGDFRHHFPAVLADSSFNAQELRVRGYQQIEVLPLLFDLEKIQNRPWNDALVQSNASTPTILFVGRIASNKHPHELVNIAAELRRMIDRPFQMVLVGGFDPNDAYYLEIQNSVSRQGVEDYFRFTGKVSVEDLAGWYRAADIFITLSEHEGFCVPLLEAMANDIPVLAFDAGAVRETMGGEGFLLRRKDPAEIAALCKLLLVDRPLRRCVIRGQRARLLEFEKEKIYNRLAEFLRAEGLPILPTSTEPSVTHVPLQYQVEGPYETSYSLALVNREVAKALEGMFPGKVGLFATEGPGDYSPDMSMVNSLPGLPALASRGYKGARPDVCIRNLYPPRVADMDGLLNFLYFAWEETGLSSGWVAEFNRSLDGMPVLSEFVRKVLIDNGVCVPSIAAGCGVDHIVNVQGTGIPIELNNIPQDCFVLLHVSSCFPRKGIDLLLEAYGRAMTLADDVVLIIKTFPNPHNNVEEQLHQRRAANPKYPKVLVINRDIPAGEMVSLYQRASALVAPTRGEGFGLPMAEAMAFDVPVITTGYGGQSDFCTLETAWLIDYRFAPAETHMGLYNSLWVEPDIDHLTRLLTKIVNTPHDELKPQLSRARALVNSKFSWAACADRLNMLRARIEAMPPLLSKTSKVAWVTSWNTKCGIAEYSSHLLEASLTDSYFEAIILAQYAKEYGEELNEQDGEAVYRCWKHCCAPNDQLILKLTQHAPDVLIIQYNFSFLAIPDLARVLNYCEEYGIVTLVELHSTKDVFHGDELISLRDAQASLVHASRILAHSLDDVNRLKDMGLVENVCLFPLGVLDWEPPKEETGTTRQRMGLDDNAFIVASYGFLLPHKGLAELIDAFAEVREKHPNARLLMVNALYPHSISTELHEQLKASIASHPFSRDITLLTDFLEDEESLALLHLADVIVFPYQATAESSSAAVRHGLVAVKPVLCTPLPIFADLAAVVNYTGGTTPHDLAESLNDLIVNPDKLGSKVEAQKQWVAAHRYSQMGQRLGGMIRGLLANKQPFL